MQPLSDTIDPGPNVLSATLPRAELMQRLAWGLDRFRGYVGINNHMGSRFTASPEGMAQVLDVLKGRVLLFLDSLTDGNSVDRKSVVSGKRGSVRVDLGCRRIFNKEPTYTPTTKLHPYS